MKSSGRWTGLRNRHPMAIRPVISNAFLRPSGYLNRSGSRWRLLDFGVSSVDVTVEDKQLVIRGRQTDERERIFLHRGIAARQFQRVFLLADGMEVGGADLENGLLSVDLIRPEPEKTMRRIAIINRDT